ncbi:NAD(P)/FAD-dependent oxidoreductase [Microbulbifer sp. 2205BS26-8]|uniref:NAD(P)/FAD-dependent oxidoreductase n=1 Tax=Microbulbifer sp. 2205BS26-8 TaxID=3064386 RepID=UPI00273EACED|nr:FAD-dependent oxidoreductase [Microbulbifer sp. 2205BS26-8]MDP5209557.1 FAD-dependent oxidoreductase [Microbulbifer sp. 2205BS26-8]
MDAKHRCIIIGGSHAAAQLAPMLRQRGWAGSISVISNEYYLPYHRPPLSKEYLVGKKSLEQIYIRSPEVYRKSNISISLGVTATSIDRGNKQLILNDGTSLNYDKLVFTTGARVRKLDIPGVNLKGVFYLRNLSNAQQIKPFTGSDKRAVIIGGGYIGLETAAALRKRGMQVTVLEALPSILQRISAPQVADFFIRTHREEGVQIVANEQAKAITGKKSVVSVKGQSGTEYPADIVIIGIGIIPNTELAAEAGLHIDNGIKVDEYARTNDANILAAGDCTSHYNLIYQRQLRLESVQNAQDQASVVANTLCGKLKPYAALPWFWSDQYNLKLQIAGLSHGYTDVVIRGDIKGSRSFSAFYLQEGKLLAVDTVNSPQEFMLGKRLILQGKPLDAEQLANKDITLKNLLDN